MCPAPQSESQPQSDPKKWEVIQGEKRAGEEYQPPHYGDLFSQEKQDALLERLQSSQLKSREKIAHRTNKEIAKLLRDNRVPKTAKRYLEQAAKALENDDQFLGKELIYKAADTSAEDSFDLIEYKPFRKVLNFLRDPLVIPQSGASRAAKMAEFFDYGIREFVWGRKLPDTRAKIKLTPDQARAKEKQRKKELDEETAPESPNHIPENIKEHGENIPHVFFAKTKRGIENALDFTRKFLGDRTSSEYAEIAKKEDRKLSDIELAHERRKDKLPSTFDRWAQENLALELQAKQVSDRLLEIVRGSEEEDPLTGQKPVLGIFDKVREVVKEAPLVADKEKNPYAIDPDELEEHINMVRQQVGRNYENLTAALRNLYFGGAAKNSSEEEKKTTPSLMESLDRNGIFIPELHKEKRLLEGLKEVDGTHSQDLSLMRESEIQGEILIVEIEGESPSVVEVLAYYPDEDKLELKNLSSNTEEIFSIHPHEHDVRQIQKGDCIELVDRSTGEKTEAEIIGDIMVLDKKIPVEITMNGEKQQYLVSLQDFDVHKIYKDEKEQIIDPSSEASPEESNAESSTGTLLPREQKAEKEPKLVPFLVIPESISEFDQFVMKNSDGKEIQVEVSNLRNNGPYTQASIRNLSGREQRWEAQILKNESDVSLDESGEKEDHWTLKEKLRSTESKSDDLASDILYEFVENEYPQELTKKDKQGKLTPTYSIPNRDSVVSLLEESVDTGKKPTRLQKASLSSLHHLAEDPLEKEGLAEKIAEKIKGKKETHPFTKRMQKFVGKFKNREMQKQMKDTLFDARRELRDKINLAILDNKNLIISTAGQEAFKDALKTETVGLMYRLWRMIEILENKLLEMHRSIRNPHELKVAEHILIQATKKALDKVVSGSLTQAEQIIKTVKGDTEPKQNDSAWSFDDAE